MLNSQPPSIQSLFDSISPQYDRFNRFSSLGRDRFWREQALSVIRPGIRVLDIGTGTGDLAFGAWEKLQGQGEVVGLDFSESMLNVAREKQERLGIREGLRWIQLPAEDIPFEDEPYDAVISGFVLRNLYQNIQGIMRGVFQSLKSGGVVSFVDLTEQENPFIRACSRLYLKTVVNLWGNLLFKDKHPVRYLGGSMERFFRAKGFANLLKEVGFEDVRWKSFWLGTVTHTVAKKP